MGGERRRGPSIFKEEKFRVHLMVHRREIFQKVLKLKISIPHTLLIR